MTSSNAVHGETPAATAQATPAAGRNDSQADLDADLVALGQRRLLGNYRQPALVLSRGKGCEVWDTSGKRYLDMYAGVAVCSLGHAHPRLTATIAEQAGKLMHTSNYFFNEENVRLAGELCERTGYDRAFFCNSGAEANEAMIKLGRRYHFARGEAKRTRFIAFHQSFHGRSMGAVTLTGNPKYHEGFGPMMPGVTHLPYGDLAAVEKELGSDDVAAIFVETVQGEGGVLPSPAGFLPGLRALCDKSGALLLLDEVQTGIARTGKMLGSDHEAVRGDAVALAKGLGGGFPIGAMLVRAELAGVLTPGTHGSTFGGNPLASAAARTVLAVIDEEGLLAQVTARGEQLSRGLSDIAARRPQLAVGERGRGLLRGLRLAAGIDPRKALDAVRERGVLLTVAGADVLRFTPPLVVSAAQIDEALSVVDAALASLS